jgi:hypothetical protein
MGGVGVQLHFLLASALRGRCTAKTRAPGIHWVDPKANLEYFHVRTVHFIGLDNKLKI